MVIIQISAYIYKKYSGVKDTVRTRQGHIGQDVSATLYFSQLGWVVCQSQASSGEFPKNHRHHIETQLITKKLTPTKLEPIKDPFIKIRVKAGKQKFTLEQTGGAIRSIFPIRYLLQTHLNMGLERWAIQTTHSREIFCNVRWHSNHKYVLVRNIFGKLFP